MRLLGTLALCIFAAPLAAQDVRDCEWESQAANIVEPWEKNSRTFANGLTRLALMDTGGEPAAGSYYLLILSPPYDELGNRQCRIVGNDGIGFGYLDFETMTAGYDPARGLTFDLPAQVFDGLDFVNRSLSVSLNQSTGTIIPELQ